MMKIKKKAKGPQILKLLRLRKILKKKNKQTILKNIPLMIIKYEIFPNFIKEFRSIYQTIDHKQGIAALLNLKLSQKLTMDIRLSSLLVDLLYLEEALIKDSDLMLQILKEKQIIIQCIKGENDIELRLQIAKLLQFQAFNKISLYSIVKFSQITNSKKQTAFQKQFITMVFTTSQIKLQYQEENGSTIFSQKSINLIYKYMIYSKRGLCLNCSFHLKVKQLLALINP